MYAGFNPKDISPQDLCSLKTIGLSLGLPSDKGEGLIPVVREELMVLKVDQNNTDSLKPHSLANRTAMCFFNSLFQCLVSQLKLPTVQAQLRWQRVPNTCECPCCAVCETLWRVHTNVFHEADERIKTSHHPHISPLLLNKEFIHFQTSLLNGDMAHQDVHELLMKILNLANEGCATDHLPLSLLNDQFSIGTKNSKRCTACNEVSVTSFIHDRIIVIAFEDEEEPVNLNTYLKGGHPSEVE